MKKLVPSTRGPFQSLYFLLALNKALGLVACKLVNGRLRPSNVWHNCFCISWVLFHCSYTALYYHKCVLTPPETKAKTFFLLSILRYTAFFLSMLPYHIVTVVSNQNFVKFSDKLEVYDDKTMMMGRLRKDNNILMWLFFVYTLTMIVLKMYYTFEAIIDHGTSTIVMTVFENTIPTVVGTYCVFVTVIYLDAIRQRFVHLNKSIVPHVSQKPVTASQDKITLHDVRYLHGVLLDSVELLDSLYGFGTLMTFTSILLEFVALIYLFLKNVEANNLVFTLLDLSFQAIFLFAMYHITAYEANCVEERVAKYGWSFQDGKNRMDKIEMMLYFYHARVSFTAEDFFILDLTILLSISSTVLTVITLVI